MSAAPAGDVIVANFWDQRADVLEVLRITTKLRDRADDPEKRKLFDEIVSALRAEFGLPEGAA